MPAIPIADSSAPMVVGIRQTSSDTSTIPVTPLPVSASLSGAAALTSLEKMASGCSVATASRKMIVKAASRMFRAISFGVFCRLAPSTSAIIRSMKLSPGCWVTRTTIRSERTFVPPVTADRSPPDSRITGADSPVIADSSTLAMPSITSPSPGITCPASTTTTSSRRSAVAGTDSSVSSGHAVSRRAMVSCLARRSVSACALPRPSATASARLANTTVSHSQIVVTHANTVGWAIARTVVNTDPISTMNMTGLCHSVTGLSLRSASGVERHSCFGSSSPPEIRRGAPGCGGCPAGSASTVLTDMRGPPTDLRPAGREQERAGRSAPRGSR